MSQTTLLVFFLLACAGLTAQNTLVITEIMYNPPESNTDSLEFIELYNNGAGPVDLTAYTFSAGVTFTFPDFTLGAGEYTLIAVDTAAIRAVFDVSAFQFTGALGNDGEALELSDPDGAVILSLTYSDLAPWPQGADGEGPSIVLCDPDSDSSDGANWSISASGTGVVINGNELAASPGAADACTPPEPVDYTIYDIGDVNTADTLGVADSLGVAAQLQGIVYGVNLRPDGLEFTLIDAAGDGIGVFNIDEDFDYTVVEGDEVMVRGIIEQFNGLTQINADTVALVSSGNALLEPAVVTELGETTESQLITLEAVSLVDTLEWSDMDTSFNITVTNGVDTFLVRIDSATDIAGTPAPEGVFNITGLGGQFDSTAPFTEAYRIVPRYLGDIELISQVLDPSLARLVRMYPNPAGEYLQLELNEAFDLVRLHAADGRQLLEQRRPDRNERLNLRNFAPGLYTLTFVKGNRIWSTQLVKQ